MIGIFDSGIGGVTILKEIVKLIPNGHFVYYSDSLNNPYGDKTFLKLYSIVTDVVDYLLRKGCIAIVIACNTASTLCVERLRSEYRNILFIATEPAYKMVYDYNRDGKTLVMATNGTLSSQKFLNIYNKYDNRKTILFPCVGLADIIECGNTDMIDNYLSNNIAKFRGVDNVVLGCTHYPLIKSNIMKVLGNVNFFDGSKGVSRELLRQLKKRNIEYETEGLQIEFVDSSNSEVKRKRFMDILTDELGY